MKSALGFLLGLSLLVACTQNEKGAQNDDTEVRSELRTILNGWETGKSHWKMVGSLVTLRSLDPVEVLNVCTATIIDDELVLTATHCVTDTKGDLIPLEKLYFTNRDELFEAPSSAFAQATSVRIVPGYRSEDAFGSPDIAIVRLNKRFSVSPLPLNSKALSVSGDKYTIVGYGLSGTMPVILQGVLRFLDYGAGTRKYGEVRLAAIRPAETTEGESIPAGILDFVDYASNTNQIYQQVCHGDSGGPVVVKDGNKLYIAGVLSTGMTVAPHTCMDTVISNFGSTAAYHSTLTAYQTELGAAGACLKADDARFATKDGGCTHLAQGLTFSRESNLPRFFGHAKNFCENLSQGGKTDWRLPTIAELQALPVDVNQYVHFDPNLPGWQFWASDTKDNKSFWRVNVGPSAAHGTATNAWGNTFPRNVICVRR